MQSRHKAYARLHIAALLILLVFICYWNSLQASFHYDDYPIILDINWSTPNYLLHALRYQPQRFVVFSSIWLNYALGGLNPAGYHFFNVVVHALNAVLVFLVAERLFRFGFASSLLSPDGKAVRTNSRLQGDGLNTRSKEGLGESCVSARLAAFAAGALFAVNTALTQSVSYVQGRSSSLCAFFCLVSFYYYCASAEHDIDGEVESRAGTQIGFCAALRMTSVDGATAGNRIRTVFRILLATVAFVLACMTKEIGVTLVAVLAIFEFVYVLRCRLGKLRLNTVLRLLPFALIVGSVFSVRVLLYGAIGEVRTIRDFWPNLFTQISVNVTYLRMLLLPIGLSIEHDYPTYHSLFAIRVIASLALLCGLLVAAVAAARRAPMFTFGFSWFLITLLPTTLIPIWDVISEHWLYLPSVGYFLMVGGLLANLFWGHHVAWCPQNREHFRRNDKKRRNAVIGIILIAIFAYGVGTVSRNTIWRNGLTLWGDAVQKAPNRARPRTNLAMALADAGETRRAIDELRIALSIDPYSYEAHSNLGTIYSREGEYDRAVEQFQLAIATFPDPFNPPPMEVMNVARAFYNMGLAYQQMGRFNSALQAYDKAIRVAPQMGEAYSNMGTVYSAMGRHAEAEMSFKKALSINPSLDLARKNLELLESLTP